MEAFEDEDPEEKRARLAMYDGVLKNSMPIRWFGT